MEGNLFIVSAPSGAGKSSLLKAVLARDEGLVVSVSHTTRAPRPGEVDGEHYHFVDPDAFQRLIKEGGLLEHAQVFDNYYGTTETSVRDQLASGRDVILEIDWQGARQVRERFGDAATIFVVPPSVDVLRQRLESRGQDSATVIARRMRDAYAELAHLDEYDFVVINDDFEQAVGQLLLLIRASRLGVAAQRRRHPALFDGLQAEA